MSDLIHISNYYNELQLEFEKNYPLARDLRDEDAIHDMRVAIKKIRALFLFLENLSEHSFNSNNNYMFFRKLFKSSGKIRDIQIQKKIVEELAKINNIGIIEYMEHLQFNQDMAEEKFSKAIEKTKFAKLIKVNSNISKTIKQLEGLNIQKKSHSYLTNKLNYISFISKKPVNSEKWHEIRTHIKQSLYIIDLMNLFFETNEQMLELHKKLKKFGEKLGKWHDYDVAYMNLYSFIQNSNFNKAKLDDYKLLLESILKLQ